MKLKLSFIFLLIVLSCNKAKQNPVADNASVEETISDSLESIDYDLNDCTFDQATQTDDFLKGIEELKNYTWNTETKTAEIPLNNRWILKITRGGCHHFELSSFFFLDKPLSFRDNKESIIENIEWIVSLLNEYDKEKIIPKIKSYNFQKIENGDYQYHWDYYDEVLAHSYNFSFKSDSLTTSFFITKSFN